MAHPLKNISILLFFYANALNCLAARRDIIQVEDVEIRHIFLEEVDEATSSSKAPWVKLRITGKRLRSNKLFTKIIGGVYIAFHDHPASQYYALLEEVGGTLYAELNSKRFPLGSIRHDTKEIVWFDDVNIEHRFRTFTYKGMDYLYCYFFGHAWPKNHTEFEYIVRVDRHI